LDHVLLGGASAAENNGASPIDRTGRVVHRDREARHAGHSTAREGYPVRGGAGPAANQAAGDHDTARTGDGRLSSDGLRQVPGLDS
jgi:hypothetical protein